MANSLVSDDQPVDPIDERLVAYLDGELDPRSRDELENELVESPDLRQRLKDFQRDWDLLDVLPSATPSEKLVETTMELVVRDITKAPVAATADRRRWWLPVGLVTASALAVAVGYFSIQTIHERQFEQKMADLELADDLNAYLDGSNIELMRRLASDKDWILTIEAVNNLRNSSQGATQKLLIADVPVDQRPQAITDMSRVDAAALASRWERFENISEVRRTEVRASAKRVSQQTDAVTLRQTMRNYSKWIASLPAQNIDKIKAAAADQSDRKKLDTAIADAIATTRESLPKESSRLISDAAARQIMSAMRTIITERSRDHSWGPGRFWRGGRADPNDDGELDRIAALIIHYNFSESRSSLRRREPDELTSSEMDLILRVLPDEELERLDVLSMDNPMLRKAAVTAMVDAAAERTLASTSLKQSERYELLSDEERLRLDLQSPVKIQAELTGDSRMGPPGSPPGPPRRGRE